MIRCAIALSVIAPLSPIEAERIDEIAAKAVAALGGLAKIKAVQSVRMTGRISFRSGAPGKPASQEIVFEKIEVNPVIDDSRFALPVAATGP